MTDAQRFQSAYLALLALAWDDLEQIGARLGSQDAREPDEITLVRLEIFRLEFFVLEDSARRFTLRASLAGNRRSRLSKLIASLTNLLDTDDVELPDALRVRVQLAQNRIYEEALGLLEPDRLFRAFRDATGAAETVLQAHGNGLPAAVQEPAQSPA